MSSLAFQLIRQAKASRAEYLNLGRCGFTELPEALFDLTWLKTLILSDEWWDWKKRQWRSSQNKGERNKLSRLPDALGRVVWLERLVFGGGLGERWEISDLKPLEKLTALTLLGFGKIKSANYQSSCGHL